MATWMSCLQTRRISSYSLRLFRLVSVLQAKSQSGLETMVTGTNLVYHQVIKTLNQFCEIWLLQVIWRTTQSWNPLRKPPANLASLATTLTCHNRLRLLDIQWTNPVVNKYKIVNNIPAKVLKVQMDRLEISLNLPQDKRRPAREVFWFPQCQLPNLARWSATQRILRDNPHLNWSALCHPNRKRANCRH